MRAGKPVKAMPSKTDTPVDAERRLITSESVSGGRKGRKP
jgi:hypothetical protein